MKKSSKTAAWILGSVVVMTLAISIFAGDYMLRFALTPNNRRTEYERMGARWERKIPGIYNWYDSLHNAGIFRDTTIINNKGYRLHAVYAQASDPVECQGTAVLAHGYTDNIISMMAIGRMYRDSLDFNILAFDQEFHGKSEGNHIQMGWHDRLNAARWTEVAHDLWPDTFMVVHGVSMGAATTMMLSGDPDPEWVDAYIEDCGYTSAWDQFALRLKKEFRLPAFPILNIAELMCRYRYGWGFSEASSINQLAKSTKPVLFIHGDNDTYVPTADVYKNYEAKTRGLKKIWLSKGNGHARAFETNPAEYTAQVREFISEVKANAGAIR